MDHIDEEAELYALGLLDDDRRDRIDEHVRTCDACVARLGAAEAAVDALVVASRRQPRVMLRWPLAVAAAFAVASSALLAQNLQLHEAVSDDGSAMVSLVQSHFAHVQFADAKGVAVNAKVIYERRGAWLDIVLTGDTPAGVRLIRPNGSATMVDRKFARRGGAASLFIDKPGAVQQVELLDGNGVVVATARPAISEHE